MVEWKFLFIAYQSQIYLQQECSHFGFNLTVNNQIIEE